MGFIPIFLYLGGFIFLFVLVVANNFKSKKLQYLKSFDKLIFHLNNLNPNPPEQAVHFKEWKLEEVEKYYLSLKAKADTERLALLDQTVKPYLTQAKLHLYWYNKMIRIKPYSFIAKITGHSLI
ncbi:MAG: hypothetical protein WD426_20535 [Anditalea sp.]